MTKTDASVKTSPKGAVWCHAGGMNDRANALILPGRYMLDTNVFNLLLDGRYTLPDTPDAGWTATHVQRDELAATRNKARKEALLGAMSEVVTELAPTASFAIGVSAIGRAGINDGSGLFQRMQLRLIELDRGKGERRPVNQVRDILIAETALKAGACLVTADRNLAQVMEEFGGRVHLID